MSSTTPSKPPAPWGTLQIPKPIQQLFNQFPLLTYPANDLPARTQALTHSTLPTLYIFTTDEDAASGLPSFNPTCLKYQTLLRLTQTPHRTQPSTNHASPTGSLPFLIQPQTSKPIASSQLITYISQNSPANTQIPLPSQKEEIYTTLLTPLRNAFLYTLYLDTKYTRLLDRLYINPSSSSTLVRKTLRYQLRSAAAASILQSKNSNPEAGKESIDEEAIYAEAKEALECLAGELLSREQEGWFFGSEQAGEFDAGLFGYLHLMLVFMDDDSDRNGLGKMVRRVGGGVLARFVERVKGFAGWGDI
ncbi:hypothetical protein QBC43DRAFT_313037 [Cladorrhinum sp. PSN259]|nr:hypothetical protein QBC43DRAFT_313037 [Cladorrhinum sp. PSN259]